VSQGLFHSPAAIFCTFGEREVDPLSLVVLGLLLGLSALFSAYEVAFFGIGEDRRETLHTEHPKSLWRYWVRFFHQAPERLLATLLLGNTLVNIAITLLVFHLSQALPQPYREVIGGGVSLLMIVLVGEILPKGLAVSHPELILRIGTIVLQLFFVFIYPFTGLLERFRKVIEQRLPLNPSPGALLEQIEALPPQALPSIERHTLRNLILLRTLPVKAFMIARMDVKAIPIHYQWSQVKEAFQSLPYIRVPVCGDAIDDIRGLLYLKDLLSYWPNTEIENWQRLVRAAYFVPEKKNAYEVFLELKSRRQHLAIVVDEYGSVAGMITLQRLLEIVFGYGEEERAPEAWHEVQSDGSVVFQAQVPLVLVRSLLELPEDFFEARAAREAENLADFLLSLAGRIPQKGEHIDYENYTFEIMEAGPYRIDRIRAYQRLSRPHASETQNLS